MALTRRQVLRSALVLSSGALSPALFRAQSLRAAGTTPSIPAFHRDKYGLIVQGDGDGGDTAQREGFVWFGLFLRRTKLGLEDPSYVDLKLSFQDTISLLEINRSGEFRRHPDPSQGGGRHSDPKNFSRDQQIPIVAALGVWRLREPLERLWEATLRRGRVCQNGDAVGADHYNLFQRSRGAQFEVDPLGELQLLGMSGSLMARGPDDVSDDLNHIVALSVSTLVNPTKTARKAIQAYLGNGKGDLPGRPHTCGSYLQRYYDKFGSEITDLGLQTTRIQEWIEQGPGAVPPDLGCSPVFGALRWYFRPETGGNPGIAELYRPIVDEYLPREGRKT
jgi:hypothetical protein